MVYPVAAYGAGMTRGSRECFDERGIFRYIESVVGGKLRRYTRTLRSQTSLPAQAGCDATKIINYVHQENWD